jgi:hypothetical protein
MFQIFKILNFGKKGILPTKFKKDFLIGLLPGHLWFGKKNKKRERKVRVGELPLCKHLKCSFSLECFILASFYLRVDPSA